MDPSQDLQHVHPVASTSSLAFRSPPTLVSSASAPSRSSKAGNAFFRDAKVCPDGSCVLAAAEDRSLSLFDLSNSSLDSSWIPQWTHAPSDALLSYEWFPGASSASPAMFTFAVGVKDHPVQLLDGADLRIRASYPIIDHQERFIAPHCMAFSPDGTSLYCGFENAIEILDVGTPGGTGFRLHTSPTRSSRLGQKGIISTLAFSPDRSGLLAAGSFSGTIGLYDTSSDENTMVGLLQSSEPGGITKVAFHPGSHLLYLASRLSNVIEVWDMRNLSQVRGRLRRPGNTNQRLGFHVDSSGTWLACGDENGLVTVFDAEFDAANVEPVTSFQVSSDAVGGTLFRPGHAQLVTVAGQRHFAEPASDESEDESEEEDGTVQLDEEREESSPSLQLWQLY